MAEVDIGSSKMDVLDTSMEVCDGPPLKKFKQVRLPFKPLDHTSQIQGTSPGSKKRKLSDNDSPSAKQMKTSSGKQTSTPIKVECDPEVSSSSEADINKLQGHKKGLAKISTLDSFFKPQKTNKEDQEEISSTIDCIDLTDDQILEPAEENKQDQTSQEAISEGPSEPDVKTEAVNEDVDAEEDKENKGESKPNLDQSFISDVSVCEDALKTPAKKKDDIQTIEETKDKDSASTADNTDEPKDSSSTPAATSVQKKTPGSTARKTKDKDSASTADNTDEPKDSSSTPAATSVQKKTPGSTARKAKLSDSKKKEKEEQRLRREKELEERRIQKQKEKEDKERQKMEKKKQKEQEKVEKEKAKQEEKEKKEQERLEKLKQKEEEKKQKEKENEAKIEAKLEEKKKKEEEKRQKDEEKRLKEEEKKQKEEEKKKEEEEKLKKEEKKKESFKKFFIQKAPTVSPPKVSESSKKSIFMPFEVKPNMRLAPVHRVCLNEEQKTTLDDSINNQEEEPTYMQTVNSDSFVARKSTKTWPRDLNEDKDVELLSHDLEVIEKVTHRAKFLFFHENTRPPYYGTWRKKSEKLNPRNPFKKDEDLLDYEVDSDDEWEEEEPGESVSSDENEDDDKDKDEDEEDADGWMVPHGYLSDGEGAEDEEEVDNASKQDLQKIRQAAWESELKRQAKPLRMIAIGCCWSGDVTSNIAAQQLEMLLKFKAVSLGSGSIPTTHSGAGSNMSGSSDKQDKKDDKSGKSTQKNLKIVPEEAMPDLIRLVHGNPIGIKNLMKEFQAYWKLKNDPTASLNDTADTSQLETSAMETDDKLDLGEVSTPKTTENKQESEDEFSISKRQLQLKIPAIAVREKRPEHKKTCWYVNSDILKQYNMEDITLPNTWKYVRVKEPKWAVEKEKEKDKSDDPASQVNNASTPSTPSGRATPTIMQFAQPMSLSKIQALGMTPVNKETTPVEVKEKITTDNNTPEVTGTQENQPEPTLPSDQKTIKDMFSSHNKTKPNNKSDKKILSPTSTKLAAQKKAICKEKSPRIAVKRLVTPKKEIDEKIATSQDDKPDTTKSDQNQPKPGQNQPKSEKNQPKSDKNQPKPDQNQATTPKVCSTNVLESILSSPELMKASPESRKCLNGEAKSTVNKKNEKEGSGFEAMDVDEVIVLD